MLAGYSELALSLPCMWESDDSPITFQKGRSAFTFTGYESSSSLPVAHFTRHVTSTRVGRDILSMFKCSSHLQGLRVEQSTFY